MNILDNLVALSITHKQLSVRELGEIAAKVHRECMDDKSYSKFILHTCNRVEVYLYDAPPSFVEKIKASYGPYVSSVLELRGAEAARHLFRVAAGLESLLIGETDVLGQLEEAYSSQVAKGITRGLLKTVVERAVRVGKRVRSETGISKGPRGLGSLSLLYLREKLGPLNNYSFCVIGAGSVGRGIVKELLDAGVKHITALNRTVEKLADLSSQVEIRPLTPENVEKCLREYDVVITAVSTFEPIIKEVPQGSRARFIVDLGVPRNVHGSIAIPVIDIDMLRELAKRYNEARIPEIRKAEEIIEEELSKLERYLRRRWVEEKASHIAEAAFKIALEEGERAKAETAKLASTTTVKRILIPVIEYAKQLAENGNFEDAKKIIAALEAFLK